MIVLGAASPNFASRLALMRETIAFYRARGRFPAGAPSCGSMERDRCFRRILLVVGDYWPKPWPPDVASRSDAIEGTRRLQRDLGVRVDGDWEWETHEALERALGQKVPEGVPSPPWPRRGGTRPGSDLVASGEGLSGATLGVLGALGALGIGLAVWWGTRKRRR